MITFTEQLPDLAQKYARKTQRLVEKLHPIEMAAGGETGITSIRSLITQDGWLGVFRQGAQFTALSSRRSH